MINLLADTNENLYERMSAVKKIKILSVVLCIILLVAGCGKASPVTPQGSSDTVTEPTVVQPERKIIKSSALPEEISDWNTVSSFDGDVDGDGDDEKITLVTSAERDRKGNFVWSDGQNWALTVYDGEECYLLYKKGIDTHSSSFFKLSQNVGYNVIKSESCSVVSNSLQPNGLYCPWNSPGQNTGVGSLPFSRGSSQPRDLPS